MHYVYLTNNIVTDQAQIDPFKIFNKEYAEQFIEAPDEVTFGWKLNNGSWEPPPGPTPEEIQAQNKQQATALLSQTDWTQVADVPLLNKQDFVDYRAAVRAVAVNPPTTPAVFPEMPQEIWSS